MQNYMDVLRQHATNKKDKIALAWANENGKVVKSISYHQLIQKVDEIATFFTEQGNLKANDIVVLLFPPGLDFIFAFLACLQLGVVPVSLKIPTNENRMQSLLPILYDCKPKCIINPNLVVEEEKFPFTWLKYQDNYQKISYVAPQELPQVAFLQYTSGATGDPKGVVISHKNFIHNLTLIGKYYKIQSNDVTVSWLPHYHDMGLIGTYLGALYFGLTGYYLAPTSFIFNPNAYLQLIAETKATIIQCPNAAYDWLVEQWDHRNIDLSSLRIVANGAEPIQESTLKKLYQTFKKVGLRQEAIRTAYGLAEATLFVSTPTTPKWISYQGHVGCGLCSEIDIKIVDPQTHHECALGDEGEIWLNSDSKAMGYYKKTHLTQETFQAKLHNETARYLRTGDLGFIHNNQLFITGRIKDIIMINGVNIYPQDIEATVENYPGIIPYRSVAFSWQQGNETKIVIAAEVKNKNAIKDIYALLRYILKHHSIPIFDLILCKKGALARTTSGKIKRLACKQLYQENKLTIFNQIEKNWSGLQYITQTFQHVPDQSFYDLGLDSLMMANLAFEIQKKLPQNSQNSFSIPELYQMKVKEFFAICQPKKKLAYKKALQEWQNRIAAINEERHKEILQDAQLPLEKSQQITPACEKNKIKNILLTGATGFIGAYLLVNLLKKTRSHLHLLVRAENEEMGWERVMHNLQKFQLENEVPQNYQKRISIYCGDLVKPHLGLTEIQWNELANTIDSIYHNAAVTNYLASYEDLKPDNVLGTHTLLTLALQQHLKYFHHISTTFIFGWTRFQYIKEENHNINFDEIDFGYIQSKWVAEQLVWQAQKLGLPIQIYRPAWVTASSNGQYSENDLITRVLVYMLAHQISLNFTTQISMMPVDKLAADIIALSLIFEPKHSVYHLTEKYVNIPIAAKYVSEKYGYHFSYLSLPKFNQHFQTQAKPKDPIYPLVPFFNLHYRKIRNVANKVYGRENYVAALANTENYHSPKYSYQEIIDFIMTFLQKNKLIAEMSPREWQNILDLHKFSERKTLGYYFHKISLFIKKIKLMIKMGKTHDN